MFIGFIISLYQFEIMSAFFWLSELTVLFIFILIVISLTFNTYFKKNFFFISNFNIQVYVYLLYILISIIFSVVDAQQIFLSNSTQLQFDFYEPINIFFKTDTYGLFLTFYTINNFEFLSLMFLILIVTIIIVNMNFILFSLSNISSFFKLFSFNFLFFFLKQQNLIKQNLQKQSFKTFTKK